MGGALCRRGVAGLRDRSSRPKRLHRPTPQAVIARISALRLQRRTGKALGSNAVVADGTQTLLCTYLSAVLLVGLVLNATLGWGWADPIAGLAIAAVALREGVEAWQGKGCCAPTAGGVAAGDYRFVRVPPRAGSTYRGRVRQPAWRIQGADDKAI